MRGEHDGILTGFFCGLLFDVFFMDILGFYALLYAYIGFFNGLANNLYRKDDYKASAVSAHSFGSYVSACANFSFLNVLLGDFNFRFYLKGILLPELVFTMLVSHSYIILCFLLLEEKFINIHS